MSAQTATQFPTLANYQTRLPSFEGPLDILLRLIERNQMEITDVSLVEVTDQFLAHIEDLVDSNANTIAEFTMVGTRLILLKSRSLLPRPPVVDEDEELDADDLVQQLRTYKRLKGVAEQLGQRRDEGFVSFGPPSARPVARHHDPTPPKLVHYDPSVLIRSLRRRLSTIPQATQTIRQRRIVSIREMIQRVSEMASRAGSFRFSLVTDGYSSRTEVATAFLAVLVLIRGRSLEGKQDGLFTEIQLTGAESIPTPERLEDVDDAFIN